MSWMPPKHVLLSPITGGASQINIYGAVNGASAIASSATASAPSA